MSWGGRIQAEACSTSCTQRSMGSRLAPVVRARLPVVVDGWASYARAYNCSSMPASVARTVSPAGHAGGYPCTHRDIAYLAVVSAGTASGHRERVNPGGGNHRGSILRLHVDTARIAPDGCSQVTDWTRDGQVSREVRDHDVERTVSRNLLDAVDVAGR